MSDNVSHWLPLKMRTRPLRMCRVRAYFNVPTGTDVLVDLKSVLEGLVTRA